MSFPQRLAKTLSSSHEYDSKHHEPMSSWPLERQQAASMLSFQKSREKAMSKSQSLTYRPATPGPSSSQEQVIDPESDCLATPMIPQRIPLSELILNTPKTGETAQNVSPEEKVIWKLTPKKAHHGEHSPYQESPDTKINRLNSCPDVDVKSRRTAPNHGNRESYLPSTPLIRKSRNPPGPSPLSLKRSTSVSDYMIPTDRPRKRRVRSSDIVFQKRVSSLLEQAQSILTNDDGKSSLKSEPVMSFEEFKNEEELALEKDMERFGTELLPDAFSFDALDKVGPDVLDQTYNETSSDGLFDGMFDELNSEELEELDLSLNAATQVLQQKQPESIDEDEMFFIDGYEELMDLAYEATQPEEGEEVVKRCKVISVEDTSYTCEGKTRLQKTLQLQEDKSNELCMLRIRDDWFLTQIQPGDIINVITTFTNGTGIIDNPNGFVILHPDTLVSSTHVADSFKCLRRAVLQDQIKATGETSEPLVYGSIIHELFQEAISRMDFSTLYLESLIDVLVIRHIEQLYSINVTLAAATIYLRGKIFLIQAWAEIFVAPEPSVYSFMADHCGSADAKPKVCINKVLDIEEHVWSPTYGLKGNIDATVQVRIDEPDVSSRTLIVPLEVKTGKNTSLMNHRAQTMLYTLMMSDRYDVDVKCGILYYVDAKESIRVCASRNEIRGLIIGRNELATWIKSRGGFPAMLKNSRDCKNCYASESCLVYHKVPSFRDLANEMLEDGTTESSGLGDWFNEHTGHLDTKDKEFLRHWTTLLNKEEEDVFRFRNELWTMISADREKLGRCFGNLVINPEGTYLDKDGEKIGRFRYRFNRANPLSSSSSRPSFLNSQINVGDPIVVSDEMGHFALANGFVTNLQPDVLCVSVDRRLHGARTRQPNFDPIDNQSFTGIVEMLTDGVPRVSSQLGTQINMTMTYRVDKDEFKSGMAIARNNIVQLFTKDGDAKRRDLIVRGRRPMFKTPHQDTQYSYFDYQGQTLNIDQRRAVEKVLTAEDYALVLGMPGTGKTTTIAHIIRALVENGKSVLLTSYTHTAVDNTLLKLKNDGIKMLRLGSIAKVHPELREFAVGGNIQAKTFEELHEIYTSPLVVATTCLGINHFIFNKRKFDYCIVDEASQITLPACIGPLRYASRFVLVGDHYQLPPLVRNAEAQKAGLDVSLFRLLSEAHPSALTILEHQYRMNEDIMLLSNSLVYDGLLKCGNESVAKRVLQIPNRAQLAGARFWVRDVLSDRYKVVFCDTDRVPAMETKQGDRTTNDVEASLIKQTVDALRKGGVPTSSIGVMSVYRSQLKLLSHILTSDHPDIEIHTADRFQGRDKEVVIISLVRSNAEKYVGELLQDWRRVNVAFTRAKSKLIIFGSRSTIRETKPLDKFVKLVEAKGWVYHVPYGAVERNSPGKQVQAKKNIPPVREGNGGKILKVAGKAVLKGRPVLRDIVNEHR